MAKLTGEALKREVYKMVRLRRMTCKMLDDWRKAQAGCKGSGIETDFWHRTSGEISYDAVVCELLRRDESHRLRAKRAAKKERDRRKAIKNGEPVA